MTVLQHRANLLKPAVQMSPIRRKARIWTV